jgi:lysophospholipase L1-like esterase
VHFQSHRSSSGTRFTLLLALSALAAACSSSPTAPPPVVIPAPQITCPAPVVVEGVAVTSQAVAYPAPVTTNGTQPVTVTCSPASNTVFQLGQTPVTCNAVDAAGRQATCGTTVTLKHRELALKRYVAFGDSMTAGENGRPINFVPVLDLPNAYPTMLQKFFATRIPSQPDIVVINEGLGGEFVTANSARLKSVIDTQHPQVLLFLEGANDMLNGLGATDIAIAIRDSIRIARDRGIAYVIVSTVLPTAPQNCPASGTPHCRGDIPASLPIDINSRLRTLVPAEGGYLVDDYTDFAGHLSTYIDLDGLHLTPAGNQALASAFWDRIVAVIPTRQLTGGAPLTSH